jgi:hypothetical protein
MSFLKKALGKFTDNGEDVLAKIPILGPLSGAETEEEKALLRKQKQLAEDAKRRAEITGPARMAALNQSMLAFAPRNRVMAQMFGPEAAFTGKQMADMSANPMGPTPGDPQVVKLAGQLQQYKLNSYEDVLAFNKQTGQHLTDPKGFAQAKQYLDQQKAAEDAEKNRRTGLEQAFALPPPTAPNAPDQAAPVRRY